MNNQESLESYDGYCAIAYIIGSGSGDPISVPMLDEESYGAAETWTKSEPDIAEITRHMDALDPAAEWSPDDVVAYFSREFSELAKEVIVVFNW